MKNVMVVNFQANQKACSFRKLETYVRAQIENSLEIGWAARDIVLLTNFDCEIMGVRARSIALPDSRLTSSKVFAVYELLRDISGHEVFWVHDLDAWQNMWFDCPPFQDIGICQYSERRRPNFNGGSVFYRSAGRDIVAAVRSILSDRRSINEETAFNLVLDSPAYKHRVTLMNSTYNVGCVNHTERHAGSDKPIRVCHFHPDRGSHVAIHLLGRNPLHAKTVNARLERLIKRHFNIP